jgi:hypothetical protein
MENEDTEIVPKKQYLFPLTPDDIVDNALQNLDEKQARQVTQKAADEIVRLAIEKRKAEYRNAASQEEMSNLIKNANLLDKSVSDYKINSTFETASGTTNVEIYKSTPIRKNTIFIIIGVLTALSIIAFIITKF